MSSYNATEVLVGGVVLACAVAFGVYASQSTGLSQSSGGYELGASFRSLEGVGVGTDVRLAGVKIGTVTGVDLYFKTFVTMALSVVFFAFIYTILNPSKIFSKKVK